MRTAENNNPEEDQFLPIDSVNHLTNLNEKTNRPNIPYKKLPEEKQCSLDSNSRNEDSLENGTDPISKKVPITSHSLNSLSTNTDKPFTIHINDLPTLISSAEPFVNPQQLFPQSGLLFLDVTSQEYGTQVSKSQKQKYTKLITDYESEREGLRKKLKIYRINIVRSSQTATKRLKNEKQSTTTEDIVSTEESVSDQRQTTILSASHPEIGMINQISTATGSESSNRKCDDADEKRMNSEKITTMVNAIALLTKQIADTRYTLKNMSSQSSPSVLLLPSPSNGLVRVYANHHYRTVKFIGEHLCLTGRLEPFFVDPRMCNIDLFSSQHSEVLSNKLENDLTHKNTECCNDTSRNRRTRKMNHEPQESENKWIGLEMLGIRNYLKTHPGSIAEEFFELPTEERAAYTTRTL
ncbi:unnamed protein product, partial [Phytomonas sp. Hart1]